MKFFHYVGIDLAKMSFDATILDSNEVEIAYSQFENSKRGINKLIKWSLNNGVELSSTVFCAESTGIYGSLLAVRSIDMGFNLSILCPLSIKYSLGITRGKSDKIDSLRIAKYAVKYTSEITLYKPTSEVVTKLKGWLCIRENIIRDKTSVGQIKKALQGNNELDATEHIKLINKKIKNLENELSIVEDKMQELIKSDDHINKNYQLLTSIKGVGLVVAVVLITSTDNFNKFNDYRKFACYCGVAPFEHSSGISIKGRTRVSNIGSKRIKTYITRSAVSSVRFDPQMMKYYKRKKAEGKNPSSVLNAVKNKVLARCFAVVRRGTPFVLMQF